MPKIYGTDRVKCMLCGKKLKRICQLHLRVHGISFDIYLRKFPNAQTVSDNYREQLKRMGKKGGKACAKRYGGWANYHKSFRSKNPEKYRKRRVELGQKLTEYCRENKKGWFDSELQSRLGKMGAFASIESHRRNYPYYINDTPFDSDEERQAMLILCKKFNIVPREGVNCHVRVNGGEIDFRPIEKLFIEYHPRDWDGLTHDQYYDQRRKLLDENGFRNCELIVVKSLGELERWVGG